MAVAWQVDEHAAQKGGLLCAMTCLFEPNISVINQRLFEIAHDGPLEIDGFGVERRKHLPEHISGGNPAETGSDFFVRIEERRYLVVVPNVVVHQSPKLLCRLKRRDRLIFYAPGRRAEDSIGYEDKIVRSRTS